MDDFFDAFNKDILDLAVNNLAKVKVNLISDPKKSALLNYYNSVESKFTGYPTTFAKEIKYLRDHGVKTVFLKNGTAINLDNLNWTGWKY